jgi:hypothetical protein
MRKIANDGDGTMSEPVAEKKQRKKWTSEETQMLVDGCNTVGLSHEILRFIYLLRDTFLLFYSGGWATGKPS